MKFSNLVEEFIFSILNDQPLETNNVEAYDKFAFICYKSKF